MSQRRTFTLVGDHVIGKRIGDILTFVRPNGHVDRYRLVHQINPYYGGAVFEDCADDDAERLRAEVEASENWYIEELERLRERAPA